MAQSENLFAETILHQLGGNRFLTMTGCKDLVFSNKDRYITMRLRRNRIGAKWLKISVNSMDTYDMKFLTEKTIKEGKLTVDFEIVTVEERKGIYDDMLQDIFTQVTGLYTHL